MMETAIQTMVAIIYAKLNRTGFATHKIIMKVNVLDAHFNFAMIAFQIINFSM